MALSLTLLAGAKLYFYVPGGTTPRNTYTDKALSIAHANPVVADSAGVFPKIFLNPALEYKATLTTSADVLVYTEESVNDQASYQIFNLPRQIALSSRVQLLPSTQILSQDVIGALLYPTSDAETDALVTPLNITYAHGDVRRYGSNLVPGTTDMTTAVRAALAVSATHPAVFQPETYLSQKLTPPAGANINLPPGCVLKDSGALGANERFLNITNDNVHIVGWGAKVQMTRADYTSGEQRHGVFIYGAQNVCVEGLESSDSGGDGFYIGGDTADPATNVFLIDCKADNNRRQGLSLVQGRHIRVIDFAGTNTTGTSPSAGIDIEPNAATDILEDIKVIRPRCTGNDGAGIAVFLANWNATSNYADIDIIEPYTADNGGVTLGGRKRPGIDLNRISSTTPCRGRVRVIDATSVDERCAGIHIYDWDINGPRLEVIRPTVINPNQEQGSTSTINGGIIVQNSTTYTTTPGNVLIDTPAIRDDDGFLNAASLAAIRVNGEWDNTLIVDPFAAHASATITSIASTAKAVRVVYTTPSIFSLAVDTTQTDGRHIGRTVTNGGASGTITFTLIAASANLVGWRVRFEVTVAQQFRIDPNGTNLIRGGTAGQYHVSSTIGDNVELECDSATTWKIVSRYGTWTFV